MKQSSHCHISNFSSFDHRLRRRKKTFQDIINLKPGRVGSLSNLELLKQGEVISKHFDPSINAPFSTFKTSHKLTTHFWWKEIEIHRTNLQQGLLTDGPLNVEDDC